MSDVVDVIDREASPADATRATGGILAEGERFVLPRVFA
jgi:hypothetical protein